MVDLKDLFVDYELCGKRYRMTPETIERSSGLGDVEVKFKVNVLDLDFNIDCMTVTYLYKWNNFETLIVLDDYHVYPTYKNYILWREGCFSAPSPITTTGMDKVIDLLNKFADYLQIKHIVTDKTQFSSETHEEDNHEDVQRSSLDERINKFSLLIVNVIPCYGFIDKLSGNRLYEIRFEFPNLECYSSDDFVYWVNPIDWTYKLQMNQRPIVPDIFLKKYCDITENDFRKILFRSIIRIERNIEQLPEEVELGTAKFIIK